MRQVLAVRLAVLVAGVMGVAFASAATVSVKEFEVEPLTRYRLSFDAEAAQGPEARWQLQILNANGLLPYEGLFDADWQKISLGKRAYTHDFLTPRDGHLLKFETESEGENPQIEALKLEKIEDENLLLNGDFSAGPDNYSGWNTHFLAELTESDEGNPVLKCEASGYAVTDPIPVQAGATYRFTEGSSPGGRLLIYDRDLLRVGMLFEGGIPASPPEFVVPPEAAFIRLDYSDGRSARLPVISQVGIELVKEGPVEPEEKFAAYPGEIVLKPHSALSEVRAAREIQHWVREISGQEIPVLAEPSQDQNPKIFVGTGWAGENFAADLKVLDGSDGYALRKKGNDIYVFGARPSGTLFGAIRLLEDNSDLIFARPQSPFGAVYSKNPKLVFEQADTILRPTFLYRMGHGPVTEGFDDGIWQGRAGLNTSPRLYNNFRRREMGGAPAFESSFMSIIERVPEFEFAKTSVEHPEFYAMVNGKREIRPKGYICYTAPGIAEAMAEGLVSVVKEYESRGEKLEFLHARTRDGWLVCTCETCMAPILLPDGTKLEPKALTSEKDELFFSTRMVQMLNQVSAEFAKTYPDILLTVGAYIYASTPPAIPHDKLLTPMFCAYPSASLRVPILDGEGNDFSAGKEWENKFREYLKRTTAGRKISMFDYHYVGGFSTVADAAREDWLAMKKTGGAYQMHLDGMGSDEAKASGINPWDYDAPEKWIMSRLMWDPSLDPQKLREEYCQRAYQEAAPEMLEFYNLIRAAWSNPDIKAAVNCHTKAPELFNTFIVKPGNEKKLRGLLVKAEGKAKNPHSKMLIQWVLLAFEQQAASLQRVSIPFIPESTKEWDIPGSTFWLQALKFDGFKKVSTWNNFEGAPSEHPTFVSVMRDQDNLYVRFDAQKAGQSDRVEIVIQAKRHSIPYYFALDRKGKSYDMKNNAPWGGLAWTGKVQDEPDHYVAMFRIPFSSIETLDSSGSKFDLMAKFARLVSGKDGSEESSLLGFSITRTHYNNYWTKLTVEKD